MQFQQNYSRMQISRRPPPIYKLPPEAWSKIASFCSRKSLAALSKVSKRCRELVCQHTFEHCYFGGYQRSLSRTLQHLRFRQTDAGVIDVRDFILTAKIWVRRSEASQYEHALPIHIFGAIESMMNLQVLFLNVMELTREQVRASIGFLDPDRKWRVTHLKVAGSSQLTSFAIERCCAPGVLEALQFHGGLGCREYRAAAKHHKQLKKLHFYFTPVGKSLLREIYHIDPPTLRRIATDFESLEWLAMFTTCQTKEFPRDFHEFEAALERSIHNFKMFPKLRHLAFEVPAKYITGAHIKANWPRYLKPTTLERLCWYFNLVARIGKDLPNLLQLCIVSAIDEFYDGRRSQESDLMAVKMIQGNRTHVPRRAITRRFPFELVDWDGPF